VTTTHLTARRLLLTLGATAVFGVGRADPLPPPAARLLPPQPAEPTPEARGLAPDFRPDDRVPAPSIRPVPVTGKRSNFFDGLTTSTPPAVAWPGGPPQPARPTAPAVVPTSTAPPPKSFVDRTWDGVKGIVGVGSNPAPPTQPVLVQPGQQVAHVMAGPPAYRWYGWGTTTPGGNPFAPAGASPRGTATWYAQTGATPGAFPVPVVNPFRPLPGSEPPVYVGTSFNPTGEVPPVKASLTPAPSQPVFVPASGSADVKPIASTFPTMQPPPAGPLPVLSPGGSGFLPESAPSEVNWQPAAPPAGPVKQSATWVPKDSPINR
jgi:hypothetical protein